MSDLQPYLSSDLIVAHIGRGYGSRAIDGVEERPQLVLVVMSESEVVLVFLMPPEGKDTKHEILTKSRQQLGTVC